MHIPCPNCVEDVQLSFFTGGPRRCTNCGVSLSSTAPKVFFGCALIAIFMTLFLILPIVSSWEILGRIKDLGLWARVIFVPILAVIFYAGCVASGLVQLKVTSSDE